MHYHTGDGAGRHDTIVCRPQAAGIAQVECEDFAACGLKLLGESIAFPPQPDESDNWHDEFWYKCKNAHLSADMNPEKEKFRQLGHHEVRNEKRKLPLALVLEAVRTPGNVGMVFRLADAFGAERIYLCAGTATPPNRRIARTARSTVAKMPFEAAENTLEILRKLKAEGYALIGLEITEGSTDIRHFDFGEHEKIALVIGAEKDGISPKTLALLDACVAIPMHGEISSLNVATAVGIALYEVAGRFFSSAV